MSLTRDLARLHSDSDGNLILANNLTVDTNTLKVDAANNRVGIGTTTPAAPLDVVSSNGVLAKFGATTELEIYADNNEVSFRADADNDENDTIFTFDIDGSEKMRIKNDGNVGIGTTSPTNNLTICDGGASPYGADATILLDLKRNVTNTGAANAVGLRLGNNSNGFEIKYGGTSDALSMAGGSGNTMATFKNDGALTLPYQPAFYAFTTNDITANGVALTSTNGVTWSESFDQGNNFSNGTFTAPVAGKYYFSVMWNRYIVQSRIAIRKNNNNYMRWEPTGRTDEAWESQQYAVLINLAASDYVTLYGEYSGTTSHPYHMGGGAWGHFGGYLVA